MSLSSILDSFGQVYLQSLQRILLLGHHCGLPPWATHDYWRWGGEGAWLWLPLLHRSARSWPSMRQKCISKNKSHPLPTRYTFYPSSLSFSPTLQLFLFFHSMFNFLYHLFFSQKYSLLPFLSPPTPTPIYILPILRRTACSCKTGCMCYM